MRIITQRIDKTTEVCPRLGLVFVKGFISHTALVRLVFPNSPCDRGGLAEHDVIVQVNRVPFDDIYRVEFSDQRRTELDFEIWRSFHRYRVKIRVEPEPFAPIGEIVELARTFASQCPPLQITFKNPDFVDFRDFLGGFSKRKRRSSTRRRL